MASPSEQQVSYKKTGGAADGAGENYEWKLLTLVYLRMLATGHDFRLASNMATAGAFDDIVLRHRPTPSEPWRVSYVQLKHKQSGVVATPALLSLRGNFSLVKYCASYCAVSASHDADVHAFGHVADHRFVLYTNAELRDELDVTRRDVDAALGTGGDAFSFRPGGDIHRALCEWADFKATLAALRPQVAGLGDDETRTQVGDATCGRYANKHVATSRDELLRSPTLATIDEMLKSLAVVADAASFAAFLSRLRVYTRHAHESQLHGLIGRALGNVWRCGVDAEADAMRHDVLAGVKAWWQSDSVYLTQHSRVWLDAVARQVLALSKTAVARLGSRDIAFEDSSLQHFYNQLPAGGVVNVRVDSRTAASALKAWQALKRFAADEPVLHVDVGALRRREDDVLAAWATTWCRLLVVDCDADVEEGVATRIATAVADVVGREGGNKLLVVIAREGHELNVQLENADCYTYFRDNCKLSEFTEPARRIFFATSICLQGSAFPLSTLVGDDRRFVNGVDLEVMSQLLDGETRCGGELAVADKFFVTRRVRAAGAVSVQVNSVRDVAQRVVLIVAEPGMGKSTLFTHLARSAKAADPAAWIVHMPLNDCSQQLAAIHVEGFSEGTARKFVEQFALEPGNRLEKLLFRAVERKLVVFIDGVDEVCPQYETQVFSLVGRLKEMQFSQIWVASRPVLQKQLEDSLGVKALGLDQFSKEDQVEFFNKVWTHRFCSISNDKCNEITENLLVSLSNAIGKDNPILGIPLMASMIAETFEDRMLQQGRIEFNGTHKLDVMTLYKSFVRKKYDIYFDEKKKIHNRSLAANIGDEQRYLRMLNRNHRLAALRVLFSPEDIDGLQFEDKEKFSDDLTAYLKEVSNGTDKIGIIVNVIGGVPHFVHRSFAEFFAARWLALNFSANRTFTERIIFDPAYKLVGDMFNRLLAEDHPLHVAVLNRDVEATERILRSRSPAPCDVNALDGGGRTPLHLAVLLCGSDRHADCTRILTSILKHRAKVDITDHVLAWRPLRYADRVRAWLAWPAILEHGGAVEDVQSIQQPALSDFERFLRLPNESAPDSSLLLAVARFAAVHVVQYLVEERGGHADWPTVHAAAAAGRVETLAFLAAQGVSLSTADDAGNTALHHAAAAAVRFLLAHGLTLDACNQEGLSAVQTAVQRGAYDAVAVLVEAGASLKHTGPGTQLTAAQRNVSLLCAAFVGHLESVKALVAAGAALDHRDVHGHTAAWVAMHGGHGDVVEWLLLSGCRDGSTALHVACRDGDVEVAVFLLSRCADVGAAGGAWWGHEQSAAALLDSDGVGGDVALANDRGETALHAAAQGGHAALVKLLVLMGAGVDGRDRLGGTPLFSAARCGHEEAVAVLIDNGADVDAATTTGETALLGASQRGHVRVVKLLLEQGACVEGPVKIARTPLESAFKQLMQKDAKILGRESVGWTPLMSAARWGHEAATAVLLKHGADVATADSEGETPLRLAARHGHQGVIKLLLAKGANVAERDQDGWSPLHFTACRGHEDAVVLLLEHGADVAAIGSKGETPLHLAARHGHQGVIKLLLAHGSNVAERDERGLSPLHFTACRGHEDAVVLLLEHGADVAAIGSKGETPLHLAARHGHQGVIKLLLAHGSNVAERDERGWTPLHFAACKEHEDAVVLLLEHGADVAAVGSKVETPLHVASRGGHAGVVQLLLARGAGVDACNEIGWTPLYFAVWKGHEHAAMLLLGHGADVHAVSHDAETPLHAAAWGGCADVVRLLLARGAGVERQDKDGWTPLHHAAWCGHAEAVTALLEHGADVAAVDNRGKTPLHGASRYGHAGVVALLKAGGTTGERECSVL